MAMNERDLDRRLAELRQDHDDGKPVLDDLRRLSAALRAHAMQPPLAAGERDKVAAVRAHLTVGTLAEIGDAPALRVAADEFSRRVLGPSLLDEVTSRLEHAVADIRRDQAEAERLETEAALVEARAQVAECYCRLLDCLVMNTGGTQG